MQKPGLILLTLFSVTLFLGLAALGWGGVGAFLSHPPFVAISALTYGFAGIAMLSSANISSGVREDRGNRWVLSALTVLSVLGGFLPAYTDRIGVWTIGGETVRWIGVVLFTVGCVLRIWPVFVLGNRFSGLVAIQEGHTLVTGGIYRIVRNPSYLGMIVTVIGWALVFRSWVGMLFAASLMIPLVSRMNSEESLLQSQFGDEYVAYRSRTWRLLPWIY